jgi:hypothetical protein
VEQPVSKIVRVLPVSGAWSVAYDGGEAPISTHVQRDAAIDAGRVIARRDNLRLVIHNLDGSIRNSEVYTPDSSPIIRR